MTDHIYKKRLRIYLLEKGKDRSQSENGKTAPMPEEGVWIIYMKVKVENGTRDELCGCNGYNTWDRMARQIP
jgi:hypothetical protein